MISFTGTLNSVLFIEGSTQWSETVSTGSYHWKSTSNQLSSVGLYIESELIGGSTSLGGDIEIYMFSIPINNFSFFEGDRLDCMISLEGDAVIQVGDLTSDYHLLVLPISANGANFFELLFEQTELLENLTHSIYINSSVVNDIAALNLKYNNTLDVRYEWDITTGLLTRKSVTSPSGLKLIIIPGIGRRFGLLIPVFYQVLIYLSNHNNGYKDTTLETV
ncbi:hypothetical protein LCGC14_1807020 [marine sediment metagenome]|uniref:Uncharacterized protein n=1 Tax=marine sediment metagenome TaxID=412755 RepID=A0A0F9JMK3_9ZZZZ